MNHPQTIDDLRRRIGKALLDIRHEAGVAQQDLARMTGKSSGAVSSAEQHKGMDSLAIMREYEAALGVPYGSILMRAGAIEMPSTTLDAVNSDPELSEMGKSFMRSAYGLALTKS